MLVQYVPAKTVKRYKCPTQGNALFWMQGMQEATEGWYTILKGDIVLTSGWGEFRDAVNAEQESILVVRVESRPKAIDIDFLEVY